MDRRFRINAPAVASEIIDGEAVIMNLKTGAYFSTRQTGSVLWNWIEQGIGVGAMIRSLEASYTTTPGEITAAVERFLSELKEHGLIRELPSNGVPPLSDPELALSGKPVFVPPHLEVYTDMRDLLLLDPIHDVDEQVGWPAPKPTEGSGE